jgi:hypothetical protein
LLTLLETFNENTRFPSDELREGTILPT